MNFIRCGTRTDKIKHGDVKRTKITSHGINFACNAICNDKPYIPIDIADIIRDYFFGLHQCIGGIGMKIVNYYWDNSVDIELIDREQNEEGTFHFIDLMNIEMLQHILKSGYTLSFNVEFSYDDLYDHIIETYGPEEIKFGLCGSKSNISNMDNKSYHEGILNMVNESRNMVNICTNSNGTKQQIELKYIKMIEDKYDKKILYLNFGDSDFTVYDGKKIRGGILEWLGEDEKDLWELHCEDLISCNLFKLTKNKIGVAFGRNDTFIRKQLPGSQSYYTPVNLKKLHTIGFFTHVREGPSLLDETNIPMITSLILSPEESIFKKWRQEYAQKISQKNAKGSCLDGLAGAFV